MPSLVTPALPAGSLASTDQPDITGDGVLLRPWHADDHEAVVAAFTDPAIQQWHARTVTDDEAGDWIGQWPQRWQAETAASWAVIDDGVVAGQIGLRRIDLDEGLASISYWVLPEARGRRVAPRSLTALTTWSFATLGLHRLELSHSTANLSSCRVAQRCGYLPEGVKRGEALHADGWHDMHAHARLASDPAA
ncbi:GNAT family N-acetyltransferase [Actinoplanes italicus]|uniref:GNAT family N-acetyltransferase n=1 Tax=Actinoplanes italicus TaxID=113567 RepID=UPI000D056E46|nr:GNAT family N-acetyltransferase [Actinoplanes italicus]